MHRMIVLLVSLCLFVVCLITGFILMLLSISLFLVVGPDTRGLFTSLTASALLLSCLLLYVSFPAPIRKGLPNTKEIPKTVSFCLVFSLVIVLLHIFGRL